VTDTASTSPLKAARPATQCVKLTGVDILDVAKASAGGQAQYVKGATQGKLQFCINR